MEILPPDSVLQTCSKNYLVKSSHQNAILTTSFALGQPLRLWKDTYRSLVFEVLALGRSPTQDFCLIAETA